MDTEAQFKEMTDNILAEDANRILDRNLVRVANWLHNKRIDGLEPSLYDLVKKLAAENINQKALVVTLAAALWRIVELEGDTGDGG